MQMDQDKNVDKKDLPVFWIIYFLSILLSLNIVLEKKHKNK